MEVRRETASVDVGYLRTAERGMHSPDISATQGTVTPFARRVNHRRSIRAAGQAPSNELAGGINHVVSKSPYGGLILQSRTGDRPLVYER